MANLIIDGITTTLYGVQTYDIVQIINGGTLDVQAYDGTVGTGTIEIHANSILIDATSSILGDARGFRGSGSAAPGEGPGGGTLDAPGSGAGHGGNGGGTNGIPGMAYGTQSGTDIERGSGGGCGNTGTQWGLGGNGGALIALYATTIEIAGIISSNGGIAISAGTGYPHFTGSGGGSGGGILLSGDTIIVSGTLSANGGPGSDALDWYHTGGDGGAGGRIKLFPSSAITSTGTEIVTGGSGGVSVGPGPGLPGEIGTIYHASIPTIGDVCIKSNPSGASIAIDGNPQIGKITALSGGICNPENTVTGLTAGTDNHTYEIVLTGYQTVTNLFSIVAGMVTEIDIGNLVPLPGSLAINITPSDAVYNVIDSLGNTVASNVLSGTTVSNLTPGTYSSTLTRTGYQDKLLSNIVIGPGEPVILTDILTPLPPSTGDVCITSNPSGASITIDGNIQSGKTTAMSGTSCTIDNTVIGLTPGTNNHSYDVTFTGYEPKTGLFSITAGMLTEIDAGNLVLIPVSAGSSGFALLSLGLLFGLILGKKKCEDKHTKEECEKTGCQWENGKCIERK